MVEIGFYHYLLVPVPSKSVLSTYFENYEPFEVLASQEFLSLSLSFRVSRAWHSWLQLTFSVPPWRKQSQGRKKVLVLPGHQGGPMQAYTSSQAN